MSVDLHPFLHAFKSPSPVAPNGLHLGDVPLGHLWTEEIHPYILAGWFQARHCYLFGEGLEALEPCLDAWSFLLPPCADRVILGRNAHGAILVLENGRTGGPGEDRVKYLCPVMVKYWGSEKLTFKSLIERWLPRDSLGQWARRQTYADWRRANGGAFVGLDHALVPIVPTRFGGEYGDLSNFRIEPIVEHYQRTAAATREELGAMGFAFPA